MGGTAHVKLSERRPPRCWCGWRPAASVSKLREGGFGPFYLLCWDHLHNELASLPEGEALLVQPVHQEVPSGPEP